MQEPTKANENEIKPLFPDRCPNIVVTEDLIMEIGRLTVDKVNKTKLIDGFAEQKRKMDETYMELKMKYDALVGKKDTPELIKG
jgi:hypothetical protein